MQEFANQSTTSTCLSSNAELSEPQALLEGSQMLLHGNFPFPPASPLSKQVQGKGTDFGTG